MIHRSAGHPVIAVSTLGFPWRTADPFLACMFHDDRYPAGDGRFGPAASLAGRDLGQDFEGRNGWRMYHGRAVPGFPQHPHRGFETVTIVRRGLVDHSDSLGATARYGHGDVQWLTAGKGILHAEMFPLVDTQGENPLELFQIWLNLPAASKMVEPHFSMLWSASIPRATLRDAQGRAAEVTVIAGAFDGLVPLAPPPASYAAHPDADVAIWTLRLDPHARLALPPARPGSARSIYVFAGEGLAVAGGAVPVGSRVELRADAAVELENGAAASELLLLQGRPLREPVAQYGPFVMNTREQIVQAFEDYQRTQFGGWPWPDDAPVHGLEPRFAHRPGGEPERP